MTYQRFISKWSSARLKESSAAQEHFIDLCRMLDEPTPADADPTGEWYCFERGARKDSGGKGWADVWKRHHFAMEYKGRHANLNAAFNQLRQYALALENPPLLIVSDMIRVRICTNWTNSVSMTYEITLDHIHDARHRDTLKWALSDPEKLRPDQTRRLLTERAAESFASLAHSLRERGHDPQAVAHFVNRLVFCMFAEDVGLLPDQMFARMLEQSRRQPDLFPDFARTLFGAMATGGMVGFETVERFNGGLFEDDEVLGLQASEIAIVRKAAALDWSEMDPSILGTLFERGLDPGKRSQLGAHYTDRDKIMLIIEPVLTRPLLGEWEREKARIAALMEKAMSAKSKAGATKPRKRAGDILHRFLAKLRSFTVLDPACGSGNFLNLALQELKDIEHRAQLDAEALGLEREFPQVGPENVRGIEINPFAAELARVSVWIGEIQWMRRHGFSEGRDPILKPLETVECRDAILGADGTEPDWPEADVIIGNPPFLGGKLLLGVLGQDYTSRLRAVYEKAVPGFADLVCYWFHKAGGLVAQGSAARCGLVATNSIRGGKSRAVLDRIARDATIFDAWSDRPWVLDGAAVRVSLACFAAKGVDLPIRLDGVATNRIAPDLTAGNADLTAASRLAQNRKTAFVGDQKSGPFDVPGRLARRWLQLPRNPNGRPNANVLKPWVNGRDIVQRPSGRWIIDFGTAMSEEEAALYDAPFAHAQQHVLPMRESSKVRGIREFWWRHWCPRPAMRRALDGLARYIATPTLAKHRLFVWLDARVCPDHQLIVIARDDDATFGILHSRFHEAWSLRLGTSLEDRPRYTPTTTFLTFPFPEGLSPDIRATDRADDSRAAAVAAASRRLTELRDRWLNPPEWVEWVEEPVSGYPKRAVPRNDMARRNLKKRTLTRLYNARPKWLADAHAALDAAVASAYGWDAGISDDDALASLLRLNRSRAA